LYSSALIFSPKSSIIRNIFWNEAPTWIKRFPVVPDEWVEPDGTPFYQEKGLPNTRTAKLSFTPDRKLVAYAHRKKISLWDVETGLCQATLDDSVDLHNTLVFSPDGQFLATISYEGNKIMLWNTYTKSLLFSLDGHSRSIMDIKFSPNSKFIASASEDHTVKLWNLRTGKCYAVLEGHSKSVSVIDYSPDGQMLASGSYDRSIRVWDFKVGEECHILKGHSSWVTAVLWAHDGKTLASGSYDKTVRLWDPITGTVLAILEGHIGPTDALVWSPSNLTLVALSNADTEEDRTMRVWDIATRKTTQIIRNDGFIFKLSFSNDDARVEANRENLFYFPPQYKPTCVACENNVLAIGLRSGQVSFMEFFPDAMPLRE